MIKGSNPILCPSNRGKLSLIIDTDSFKILTPYLDTTEPFIVTFDLKSNIGDSLYKAPKILLFSISNSLPFEIINP